MQKYKTSSQAARWSISLKSSCPLLWGEKVKTKLETNFTNKIAVGDVIQVIEEAVSAQYEPVWMTPDMLDSSTHSIA